MTSNKHFFLLLATAFLFSLASCVSDSIFETPGTGYYDGERTVSLRLAPTATTRGESRPIGDNEPVFFRTGDLYLVTSAGIIFRHFSIVACDGTPATETDIAANRINRSDLYPTGVALPSMPGNVRYVVVVGNHSQSALPSSGMVGTTIENRLIHNHILSQYGALYPDPGVNLFGRTEIVRRTHDGTPSGTPVYSTTYPYNALFDANVLLEPTVARFEIHQMTAGGTIVDFTVAGIFIDRHYRRAQINGFIPETIGGQPNLMERGTTSTAFQENAACGYYPAGNNALFDEPGVGAFISDGYLIARPESTTLIGSGADVRNVWSYHVFAQSHDHTHRNITPPRIVIRLTGVRLYYEDEIVTVPDQYITVHGFTNTNTGIRLGNIRAGNVYRILNLAFDETNLHYRPSRPMNVEVCVQLAEWSSRPINPAGFRQPNPIGGDAGSTPATWHFPLGEAIHGSCTEDIVYLWQWSHTGGRYNDAAWTPFIQFTGATNDDVVADIEAARENVTNALFINQTLSVNNLMQTTFFRRIAMACGNFIRSEQAEVTAIRSFLHVHPTIRIFPFTANNTQTITVRTNVSGGWSIIDYDDLPYWISLSRNSGLPTDSLFNVDVATSNTRVPPRTATFTVRAGSLEEEVIITQMGSSGGYGLVIGQNPFVGAFWRNWQVGERLINMPYAGGGWTAFASHDWIILDTEESTDPYVGTDTPANLRIPANDELHSLDPATASHSIRDTGNIIFRIGLTGPNPRPEPRYGQVVVVTDNNAVHVIWIRQGEAADYLMRASDNGRGDVVRRFSPFNLAAPPNLWNRNLDERGGVFTDYPSQAGAFFQWASAPTQLRRAWIPHGGVSGYWDSFAPAVSGVWATIHEACPPGFRRPNDGPPSSNVNTGNSTHLPLSEVRQSLFLIPTGGGVSNPNNSVLGFYADGFFDRRPIHSNHYVSRYTTEIAYRGTLFFNPISGASLFFPIGGWRTNVGGGNFARTSRGWYWTSSSGAGGLELALPTGINRMSMGDNNTGAFIRCVVEPTPPEEGGLEERRPGISLSPDPFP